MKAALTIAGSDSSGGAGIQADLKTFQAFHVFGTSAITAITAQNTAGVFAIQAVDADVIKEQIRAVLSDIPIGAAKTGMLFSVPGIKAFLEEWEYADNRTSSIPLVVDPVMVSTSGKRLLTEEAEELYPEILKKATLITPNLPEASVLIKKNISAVEEVKEALLELYEKTGAHVLIKGGHGLKNTDSARDILYDGKDFTEYDSPFINSSSTHGTGCTLSAAITACLALGDDEKEAVRKAKEFVQGAIRHAPGMGSGHGPLNHMWRQHPGS